MIKHNITGRILKGKYKNWYISIRPTYQKENPDDEEFGATYVYIGQKRELNGGAKNGTYNDYYPEYGWVKSNLRTDGIMEGDVVYIEWLDDK